MITEADDQSAPDNPILRATISELTIDMLDAQLAEMRDRRLTLVRRMEEIQAARTEKARLETASKLGKQMDRVRLALTKVDEALERAEAYMQKARLLAMELEE